jgi:hypothetical protein
VTQPIANRQSQIKNLLGYALAILALVFLGRVLVQTWDQIAASNFRFEFDVLPLIVSLVLLTVARVFAVEAWRRVLLSLGERTRFWLWFARVVHFGPNALHSRQRVANRDVDDDVE